MPAMSLQCAASAKVALPTTLRNIFLSEFRHDLYTVRRSAGFTATRYHQPGRPFSSTNRFFQLHTSHWEDVTTNPSSSARTASPTPEQGDAVSNAPPPGPNPAKPTKSVRNTNNESKSKDGQERKVTNTEKRSDRTQKPAIHRKKKKPEPWQSQKGALQQKFPAGWNPPKKLSPDALDGIRHLHASDPERFTTAFLADEFKVSPEAIRRILKSRWKPNEVEMESRRQRWERRHERIWSQMTELGLRPPSDRSRALSDSKVLYDRKDKK